MERRVSTLSFLLLVKHAFTAILQARTMLRASGVAEFLLDIRVLARKNEVNMAFEMRRIHNGGLSSQRSVGQC